ncbi:hypothetical protein [Actinoplanes sp. NPDC049681]|uniref:hypothetical protein n=1 Tax=Actinoplanes sp. NPDC049681 TaxID=3363905 RepID=UPI0037A9E159
MAASRTRRWPAAVNGTPKISRCVSPSWTRSPKTIVERCCARARTGANMAVPGALRNLAGRAPSTVPSSATTALNVMLESLSRAACTGLTSPPKVC